MSSMALFMGIRGRANTRRLWYRRCDGSSGSSKRFSWVSDESGCVRARGMEMNRWRGADWSGCMFTRGMARYWRSAAGFLCTRGMARDRGRHSGSGFGCARGTTSLSAWSCVILLASTQFHGTGWTEIETLRWYRFYDILHRRSVAAPGVRVQA